MCRTVRRDTRLLPLFQRKVLLRPCFPAGEYQLGAGPFPAMHLYFQIFHSHMDRDTEKRAAGRLGDGEDLVGLGLGVD